MNAPHSSARRPRAARSTTHADPGAGPRPARAGRVRTSALPSSRWRSTSRGRDQVPGGLWQQLGPAEAVGALVLGLIGVPLLGSSVLALAGVALASAVAGDGWVWPGDAQWLKVGLHLLVHLDDPASAYPGPLAARVAPPGWCWAGIGALVVAVMALMITAARWWLRRRGSADGMASATDFPAAARRSRRGPHRLGSADESSPVVYVGREALPHPYAYLDGRGVHARAEDTGLVNAPARSGKSLRAVVQRVVDAVGAVVTTSTRHDVIGLTEGIRSRTGAVHVFDPDQISSRPSLRWDLVAGCEDPRVAMARAEILVDARGGSAPESGSDSSRFFTGAATTVLRCLLHAAALSGASMREVITWARNPHDDAPYSILRSHPQAPLGWGDQLAGNLRGQAPVTTAGIVMTVGQVLDPLALPSVLELLCPPRGAGFNVQAFVNSTDTVYVLSLGETTTGRLTTALVAEIDRISRLTALTSPSGRLQVPLMLVLDEAANIAALPTLPSLMSEGGGRGVITWVFVQSYAQMVARWGQEGASTIFDSAAIMMVLGGSRDSEILGRLSRLCGQRAVTRTSLSLGQQGASRTTSVHLEDVITPDEIRQLPDGQALLLYRNQRPAVVYLPGWWERADADQFGSATDSQPAELSPRAHGPDGPHGPAAAGPVNGPMNGPMNGPVGSAAFGATRWSRPPTGVSPAAAGTSSTRTGATSSAPSPWNASPPAAATGWPSRVQPVRRPGELVDQTGGEQQ